jgi:hypothetical protein
MQIILEKSSTVAMFLFEDDDVLNLSSDQLDAPNLTVTDINSNTHKIVSGPAPENSPYWVSGALTFDGVWEVSNQELYDARLQRATDAFDDKIAVAKAAKLSELATIRWNAEESGTTFGGNPLATDRTTQAKLTAGYAKAVNDPDFVIASWKFAAGVFVSLDATTIIAAANAVEAHIQACFTNEAALSADVLSAVDFAALEAVDLTVGWQ